MNEYIHGLIHGPFQGMNYCLQLSGHSGARKETVKLPRGDMFIQGPFPFLLAEAGEVTYEINPGYKMLTHPLGVGLTGFKTLEGK